MAITVEHNLVARGAARLAFITANAFAEGIQCLSMITSKGHKRIIIAIVITFTCELSLVVWTALAVFAEAGCAIITVFAWVIF